MTDLERLLMAFKSEGLDCLIKTHVKLLVSKKGFLNMAFDWVVAELPTNQMPGLKIVTNIFLWSFLFVIAGTSVCFVIIMKAMRRRCHNPLPYNTTLWQSGPCQRPDYLNCRSHCRKYWDFGTGCGLLGCKLHRFVVLRGKCHYYITVVNFLVMCSQRWSLRDGYYTCNTLFALKTKKTLQLRIKGPL